MTTHTELSDKELLYQMENCTIDPDIVTHEVLLRLSWILIHKYGIDKAIVKNCEIKEQFFIKVLNSHKFNLPLTKAYTEILYYFMENSNAKTLDKLLREFPRLKYNFNDLVKLHYGVDSLKPHRTDDLKPKDTILFTF